MIYAFTNGSNGDIFVQKAPASTVGDIAKGIKELLGKPDHEIKIIGTRHGEKLYEALLTREERVCAIDHGEYFRVPADTRDLNYGKYFDQGNIEIETLTDYNSHNTNRLDLDGTKYILLRLDALKKMAESKNLDQLFEGE